jgi:hypothetical protein
MSSSNCPYSIFLRKEDPKCSCQKDKYLSIHIPLDANDPTSQKITQEWQKLDSTEVEDVLEYFSMFDNIVSTLALPTGLQCFCLIPAYMGRNAQKKWMDIVTNHANENTQRELEECVKKFQLLFMEDDISLDKETPKHVSTRLGPAHQSSK